jgi:hypothetical protein
MTDREILDRFNAGIRAAEALTADYQHVALEVPPGRPQIAYFSQAISGHHGATSCAA